MESALRIALIDWLASDPLLNSITEEVPTRTSAPWLAIATSASIDWSTKDRRGREVRVALELHLRGEEAGESADLAAQVADRIDTMPAVHSSFRLVSTQFLRGRAEQRANLRRAVLLEYRFRLFEA
ncbi:DUF3168 domain-containing protein [Aurantiacibacter flavus]|uniref:DUF3168 domain-containing protein n=1 Tax=Aurantiacibacter flavus TaxID=3145232 RepID=A0ABV0CZJ2_9SPHN